MPLDPEVATWLSQLERAAVPLVHTISPAEARQQMIDASALLGPGEAVQRVEDRQIAGPGGDLLLRVYRPRDAEGLRPVAVYFHGGGWVVGSVDTHDSYCRLLANASQTIVVSVDYRLAPEHKYPAAAEDAYAATCWTAENAAEFGGDSRRLAVVGDSAGGNLAAVAALLCRDRGGPALAYQVLIYPITDADFQTSSYTECADGYMLTRDAMIWFWRQYLADETQAVEPYVSPLRAESLADLPPALVLTAEYDPLRDEGEAYARRLEEAGVAVTAKCYAGMIHGFTRRTKLLSKARQCLTDVAGELQRNLGE